jgi:hypothetical protein
MKYLFEVKREKKIRKDMKVAIIFLLQMENSKNSKIKRTTLLLSSQYLRSRIITHFNNNSSKVENE